MANGGGIKNMGKSFKDTMLMKGKCRGMVGLLTKSASTEGMGNRGNGPSTHGFGVRVFDIFDMFLIRWWFGIAGGVGV